jgi:putative DNA primase/helicase
MNTAEAKNLDHSDVYLSEGAEGVRACIDAAQPALTDWPDPKPIPSTLLPVDPFDSALLPGALRKWVMDIADRMQCPPDFPAIGAMVALSSVIGRKAGIKPKRKDDWVVIPNLWGAVVGRPGVMKSPALSEVLRPLDRMAKIALDEYQNAKKDFDANKELQEIFYGLRKAKAKEEAKNGNKDAALKELQSDDGIGSPPVLRRYKITDATVEALGEILIDNPLGTLAYRDELNGLLRSLDKEGQEGARAFYLQGYDGNQSYTFDRILRGKNNHIPAVCIAMLGGIQPGKLQSYIRDAVNGGAGDDGLLQRFSLMVWPDIAEQWTNVDRWPDKEAKHQAFELFKRLDALQPIKDDETGESIPVEYRFTDQAQTLFDEWRQEIESRLRTGEHHPAFESHLSKYRKLVPAIALACALAESEIEVSESSLSRALAWAEYLESHAARIYAAGTSLETDSATALLNKIKAKKVEDNFKAQDVYLKGWARLNSPEAVKPALRMLCDLDCLKREDRPSGITGGRPSTTYSINPKLFGGV